jgi:hypothetical protein
VSLCKAQTFRFQTTETLQGRDVRHISRSTRLAAKAGSSTTSCPRTDSVSEVALSLLLFEYQPRAGHVPHSDNN